MFDDSTNIIFWYDDFNTERLGIDKQHQKLFTYLNDVAICISSGVPLVDIAVSINAFIVQVEKHLSTEEKFWSNLYPAFSEIINNNQQHSDFIKSPNDKKLVAEDLRDEQINALFSHLLHWLISHVLVHHKYIEAFLLSIDVDEDVSKAIQSAEIKTQNSSVDLTTKLVFDAGLRLMHEIKDRYETLSEFLHSEERLQEVMEYAKIGYWVLPKNSNQAYWSSQIYHLFGLTSDAKSGPETLCSIMNNNYHDSFYCSVAKAFDTGGEHHVEYPIVRPNDGETRWIECKGKIIFNEDGIPEKLTGFVQDITERKENENRIEELAYYDPLTHLPNRRFLLERLNHTIASTERNQQYNALLFLDIDDFKTLNDSHGHDYGDLLLSQSAIRISHNIRSGDTVSRIGGDEFVVILEKLSREPIKAASQAENIAQNILRILSEPYQINEIKYTSTCSIGLVIFQDNTVTAAELMKQADIAMYQAKQAGKNLILRCKRVSLSGLV